MSAAPAVTAPVSAFEKYRPAIYPFNFKGTMVVKRIAGGIPTDPKVAEGWLKTKLGVTSEDLIREQVAEVMVERQVDQATAAALVDSNRHLNGFKRKRCDSCPATGALCDGPHMLIIEGRQLKAAIKEAASVHWPKDRWGPSRKGTTSFFAEHVFVQEDQMELGVTEPTGIAQRFVHTWRGSSIQYEEYVDEPTLEFTITTDYNFPEEQWGALWLTGEQQGIGATRSQGYGRYTVTSWEAI